MWGLSLKRDGVETWCVFLFSAWLLVLFYWASPADKLPLLRSTATETQHYNLQYNSSNLVPISVSPLPLREPRGEPEPEQKQTEVELKHQEEQKKLEEEAQKQKEAGQQKQKQKQKQKEEEQKKEEEGQKQKQKEAEEQRQTQKEHEGMQKEEEQKQEKQKQEEQNQEEQKQKQKEQNQNHKRVAICLVGGLRAFELTGPSIRKYLLDVYPQADLFVHSPIDKDVHKLTVLAGRPHLASVRLFIPSWVTETHLVRELLRRSGSPNGIQGLLQYFNLVEGCWSLIEAYEAHHNFTYDWVIRSRVDGYWNGPMPPIEAFNASKYYVPYGSSFHGLNDRLGIGTRDTSRVALQRLSLLPEIYDHGFRTLNSEMCFKAQFTTKHVEVDRNRFPFCVLSTRKYNFPHGVPVASIASRGPLNGAKCRPCTPKIWKALEETKMTRASIGSTDEAGLCDARKGWEKNWEEIYDSVAGPDMAEVRQRIGRRTLDECIRDMQLFQREWEFWNATSPEILCGGLKPENTESVSS
ncbi:unnamed protein product [Calypogeia fissa]